ncbi:hypothetical protein E3E26_09810 [Thermococcus sp. LS1]|uniref:hypothetical protein n=1 Tax=Thermococcus sp. LS1 TaxID=1638259 RepID=UPI001439A091|nr:hypothetical protein [Thermococcus sp. LS1]NJE00067.1 hypothetical protein [Thermococcus sp. LS1]
MYFRVFISFFVFTLFLIASQVSAAYPDVKITTEVVPGDDDFFVELSTYGVYNLGDDLRVINLTEDRLPRESFMFYVSNGSSYVVWRGDLSSEFHRVFYSNGSWYLLLQGGYPLLRIDGKPFSRVYPYNSTYTAITVYRIKNGCIEPTWAIPSPSPGIFGPSRLENDTVVFSSYSEAFGRGFVVRVPLKSFEKYLSIINASAFVDSLLAAQLSDSTLVIFFPELYYFKANGSIYAGIVKNDEFIPVFKSEEATGYVFVFHGVLDAIPTLMVNVDNGEVFPKITSQYNLCDCYGEDSSLMLSYKTTAETGSMNLDLILLGLVLGILTGGVLGYKFGRDDFMGRWFR